MLGIPGTNDQGIGRSRATPATRVFNTGFSAVGNRDGWNPIFRDERTYSLSTNLTKVKGRHDIRGGYLLNFLYLDHWQPETGNPRGQFDFNGDTTALRGGAQTDQLLQPVRVVPARPRRHAKQERAERADDRARMAARAVHPRPVDAEPKLTLDLGHALRALPDHAPGGRARRSIASTSNDARRAHRRPRRQPAEQRHEDELEQLRAAARRDLPAQRQDGVPHRLRRHLQRARRGRARCAATTTIRSRSRRASSTPTPFGYLRARCPQGIPTIGAPDQSSGRVPLDRAAAEYTPEIDNIDRGYVQTWNVAFERRLPFDTSVDVAYVGAKGTGGYAALDINAPTVARRRRPGPSVLRRSDASSPSIRGAIG